MTGHEAHHPSPTDLLWPAVNFILFVALLFRVLRGPVREHFRRRSTELREALAAGARARREAEELRAAIARDVADLPAMRERLWADLQAAAERERETIVGLGRQVAERIRADARLLAAQQLANARQALRAEGIDEAVRQATTLLRGAVHPDDQERFVHEFVASAGAP